MRILGIDPGSRRTGFAIIDAKQQSFVCIDYGVLQATGDFPQRLAPLFSGMRDLIRQHQPEHIAIEDVFVSKNVASALKLGQARGALLAACLDAQLSISAYAPTKVKQAVVGTGRASKEQVHHMVQQLLGIRTRIPEDAADAMGVAICAANHAHMERRLANMQRNST